jgi:trehalose-6-phosphatase
MPILPNAIICDIDGTLAHMTDRGPYDTSQYATDSKDDFVHSLFAMLCSRYQATRIIVSGRSEDFRNVTEQWLTDNGITYKHLYMRPSGNKENDRIVKREIYEQLIQPHYTVVCCIDDRNRVVDMWRNELNLRCLQVTDGDF